MAHALILIEGNEVKMENLYISLSNAKQVVIDPPTVFGYLVQIRGNEIKDVHKAILDFTLIPEVTGVIPLIIKSGDVSEG
ncbi:hypothetical protein [Lunatibacter salilacus]|uniref:hypothetical protein n=1 Tax=Lunatibacter salilacus TaxID=2483804 RepID=UPI00131BA854|nr:hypothetical protein [Lunatibacter salilacus]